jgi:hypothetical protein
METPSRPAACTAPRSAGACKTPPCAATCHPLLWQVGRTHIGVNRLACHAPRGGWHSRRSDFAAEQRSSYGGSSRSSSGPLPASFCGAHTETCRHRPPCSAQPGGAGSVCAPLHRHVQHAPPAGGLPLWLAGRLCGRRCGAPHLQVHGGSTRALPPLAQRLLKQACVMGTSFFRPSSSCLSPG